MGITAKGPVHYPLGERTPDQFEILTFLLAREEFPGVVHVRQNDYGLDVRLPDTQGNTLRGWQSKRFTGKINWPECQESVRRALAFWRPPRITFVFPKFLSGAEQKKFREDLIEKFPRVRLDWWDDTELQQRIRATKGGQDAAHWLFSNPEADKKELRRVIAVGGELSDTADAAERVAEVQKFMGRDPHLTYATIATEGDHPVPPLTPGTVASVDAEVGEQRVRFDATERYPGAAIDAELGGRLVFAQDEEGRRAREAVMEVIHEGGSVRVTSGIAADFAPVPVGLRGLMPDQPVEAEVEITALESKGSPPLKLPMLLRAGSAELGVVLTAASPPDGWEHTLAGAAGGLEVFLSRRGEVGSGEARMDWRWTLGEGTALAQLLAAEVMLEAFKGAPVELLTPRDDSDVAAGTMDRRERAEEELDEVEHIRDFLSYVAEAEAWLGTPLSPPARPSETDAKLLSELITKVRQPDRDGKLERIEFVLSRSIAEIDEPFQLSMAQALRGELFGEERYLGTEWIYLPRGRFEGVRGDEDEGDTVAVVPSDPDEPVKIRFYPPTEVPEGATQPPG